ncbi:hypothetical protein [Xanthobacter tagetidis]|uniref:Uncharacterized protein n=1 Tax=Xanthobacter tagetidis TaxID=60216 RepID=A0A3L7AGI2_9HYPH|nr:hypothetical protein [Xanthobacter tagetidis]MBB6306613.1 hypothetical protein [Xanthobacter tagetidis]RLP79065.1 hypothetical protein D9R14_09510 [Xanthobacter tagetidis]
MGNGTDQLLADADLVLEAASSLGRLDRSRDLGERLARVRAAVDAGAEPDPKAIGDLRLALNDAIAELAPVTLGDLRTGWRPFRRTRGHQLRLTAIAVLCLLIVFTTAKITIEYERTSTLFATTKALHASRPDELAAKLYFLLKKNGFDALTTPSNEKLYDQLITQVADLRQIGRSMGSYSQVEQQVVDGDPFSFIRHLVSAITGLFASDRSRGGVAGPAQPGTMELANASAESARKRFNEVQQRYRPDLGLGQGDPDAPTGTPEPADPARRARPLMEGTPEIERLCFNQEDKKRISCAIGDHLAEIRQLMVALNIGPTILNVQEYTAKMISQKSTIDLYGRWLLPALYGMIGSMLFILRRYLDPASPDPSILDFLYRITLGGFAGIIAAWLWTPASADLNLPTITSAGAFGIAFLVGFSTDVLFGALERLSKLASDAMGKPPGGGAAA